MKHFFTIIKEQVRHFYLIRRLSLYELKHSNQSNYLGMSWLVINPLIQIFIYWFVFQNIRQSSAVEIAPGLKVPYFDWLIVGFILYNYLYQSVIDGSRAIYSRLLMLSKMNFPMSVIPSFVIFSNFYIHGILLLIVILYFQFAGFTINIYYLQLIYFIFASFCFLFSFSLIMSTLSTIVRDIHMFLNSTLRMLLYLSPVLWQMNSLPHPLNSLVKLNPFYYLIEGYRAALFGTDWYFITHWQYSLYFWGLIIFLFLLGSTIHVKFRRHFIDYL
jgi:teichoic acid transport system permease protein